MKYLDENLGREMAVVRMMHYGRKVRNRQDNNTMGSVKYYIL